MATEETLKLLGSNVSAILVTVQASKSKMPTLPSKEEVEKTPGMVGHHCGAEAVVHEQRHQASSCQCPVLPKAVD